MRSLAGGLDREAWMPFANTVHSSTGVSPFMANYAFHPTMDAAPLVDQKGDSVSFMKEIKKVQDDLKAMLAKTHQHVTGVT